MSKPSRYEKAVIIVLPTLLGASFLVRLLAHGAVSAVALWLYLALAVTMLVWVRRHEAARGPSKRQHRERAGRAAEDDDA